ncbi:MAG: class I SAM-dependent methyltransferase [Solirubrobacteraceae bacterium]
MTSKKQASRDHFDRWARRYESDPASRWLATLQQAAVDALALAPSDRLLDIGCGTGAAVRGAAATVERAVGVDLSAGMVARGRELAAGMSNVELLSADAEALPFEDGAFTAVLCTTSFHHYPHPERAVGEMARVLAPGGRVVIADMTTDAHVMRVVDPLLRHLQASHVGCHRSAEIERLLSGAGLLDAHSRSLAMGVYAIVAARKPVA